MMRREKSLGRLLIVLRFCLNCFGEGEEMGFLGRVERMSFGGCEANRRILGAFGVEGVSWASVVVFGI